MTTASGDFPPDHPLLGAVRQALARVPGQAGLALADDGGALARRIGALADPEEQLALAESLATFAYFLEVKRASPVAAQQVLRLAVLLVPALEAHARGGAAAGQYDADKARAYLARERAARTGPVPGGGLKQAAAGVGVGLRHRR